VAKDTDEAARLQALAAAQPVEGPRMASQILNELRERRAAASSNQAQ
jgi:hypothetical protein